MCFWIELAADVDGTKVMGYARQQGVECRPGDAFFGDGGRHNRWFRMAFTMIAEEELVRGVRVLSEAIRRSR